MPAPILPRVAASEPGAAEEFLARYGGLVWSLVRLAIRNAADAEEAVQDVFVEVWRQAGRFDSAIAPEATFVAMIARRRIIDRLRHERRRRGRDAVVVGPDTLVAASRGCPVELADEAASARQRLASLKPDERRFVEWSVCEGLSHAEIAARSGQPLGTVKSHIQRGLKRLRELLGAVPAAAETQSGGVP
ncbi:MAG: sigma-70 family RNA polymerase sigma factor [Planctomycetota bacterium]|jgi:RNA polymerase sigma-70 factor (ECF subfamily)|nr:MAG: sigma-70 family RNA polymerase sigma factor [Planctomycetota bacterium]